MSAPILLALLALLGQTTAPADPPAAQAAPAPTAERDPHQLFTEANRLFNGARSEEELRKAVGNYQALIARGIRNGHLYYNLGCALLRLRDLGPAILNLRRALLYLPEDARALATLRYAQKQVPDEFPRTEESKALRTLFFWHYQTTFEARLWVALLANAAFWTLLASRLAIRLPFHRTILGILLGFAAASGGSLAADVLSHHGTEAVIVQTEIEVRSGNGAGFPLLFSKPVHSGVEVRIIETRGNWTQLEFPNDARGWVLSSAVEPLGGSLSP